jgi:HK97 family phage prohead protease
MKRNKPEGYETRTFTADCELRAGSDGSVILRGLASVFETLSENLGGFREIISAGAFDETDVSDVRGLFNHDANFVLGRTVSKTLRLSTEARGLQYEIDMPTTQTIADLVIEPIRRGDVSQSSFAFIVGRGNDEWDENEDGVLIRTIRKVQRLFDVSPVTYPAYTEATVGIRSMETFTEQRDQDIAARLERKQFGVDAETLQRRAQLINLGVCP